MWFGDRAWRLLIAVWFGSICICAWAGDEPDALFSQGNQAFNRGDVVEAIPFYRRAAELGYAPAQARLGYIMDKAEENQEALQWYRKAAEQGDANGQYGLGQMYAAGKGVAKDPVQGLNWMKQAASQGLLAAVVAVAQMLEHGDPKSIGDVKAALDYWRRAAELGDHGAMRRLAAAYRKGELGLQADPSQAQAWEARLAKAVGATPQPRKK